MRRPSILLDLVVVAVFVGIGRSVHSAEGGAAGFLSTAWPFVTGLGIGSIALCAQPGQATSLSSGVVVCCSTVTIGMVLRVISGQGTAVAFVLVAFGFLGAGMLGWRMIGRAVGRTRPERPPP